MVDGSEFIGDIYIGKHPPLMKIELFGHVGYICSWRDIYVLAFIWQFPMYIKVASCYFLTDI